MLRLRRHFIRAWPHVTALQTNKVLQSNVPAASDKKFHCSVCKKPFRLEIAAKLHLQQAHGGSGAVEAGCGPGQPTEQIPSPVARDSLTAPGSGPVRDADDEPRRPRRSRPIPKPLHQPTFDIPATAMNDMLAVWDKIGLSRVDNFIHSSMIMKVFAAQQSETSDAQLYAPEIPVAEGANPFCSSADADEDTISTEDAALSTKQQRDFDGQPFAYADSSFVDPFQTAAVDNPFLIVKPAVVQKKPVEVKPSPPVVENAQAPVTPFGQLPVFGSSVQSASPFAAAASANSPFTASSPFAAAANAASPFAASPFASSPFAASASPFGSSPFPPADAPIFPPSDEGSTAASTEVEKKHTCSVCGKSFTTEGGLAGHAQAKHGIHIPVVVKGSKKGKLPDLPAYVPCPVDIGSTQPFGSQANQASWAEVELIPHAHAISNISLIGEVLEIETVIDGAREAIQLSILVPGQNAGDEETFLVKCTGEHNKLLLQQVRRHSTVHVSGTLRLLPLYEQACNKYFQQPVVKVSPPIGSIFVLE